MKLFLISLPGCLAGAALGSFTICYFLNEPFLPHFLVSCGISIVLATTLLFFGNKRDSD